MTAEIAVALPTLMLLLALLIWMVAVGATYVRCLDAAREGARALARDESVGASRALAAEVAPSVARVDTQVDGDLVRVTVTVAARPPGPVLSLLPAITVTGNAASLLEEG